MRTDRHVWKRQVSRRRTLGGVGVSGLGAISLALIGCDSNNQDKATSEGQPATQATAGEQPKYGGTHSKALTSSINDVLDPHTSLNQALQLWPYIGDTTLRWTRDASAFEPQLVESWEIPSDGMQMILKVRPGVKWHNKPPVNGREWDAEDLAYNLTRITGDLNPGERARFQRATDFIGMASAKAVDPKTVVVSFERPTSTFLAGMCDIRNAMVPRDFLDKGGKFEDTSSLIGTGPFVLESWKDLQLAVLKRNPNYWRQGLPYLDTVRFVWLGDRVSEVAAFAQGEIGQIMDADKAVRETIKKTANGAQEEVWFHAQWDHFRLATKAKPLDDVRVRRALFLVLDYKSMNDAYYADGYWRYTGPLSAAFNEGIPSDQIAKMPGWNPATKEQDTKTAKDLMTAAGLPDGEVTLKILLSSATQTGQSYENAIRARDRWKTVWPKMQVEIDPPPDGAVFSRRQNQGDFQALSYTILGQPDAVLELTSQYHSEGSRNYGKFSDARIDQLLDKAARQIDMNERKTTLVEVQNLLINEHMSIITVNQPNYNAWFAANVRGMKDYGGRVGGGRYDTHWNTVQLWLA